MKKILLLLLLIPIKIYAYDKAVVDINELSITQLQEYVDKGYLTYEKITQLYLDRIKEYDDYNAIITINENALEQAKKLDIEYQKSGRTSLIYGLPVIVKDNIDVVGLPTTNGTKALLDSYPNKNADVVQKLIDNGAIVIAKANMDEFAMNALYSYSSFGYVYNAYNKDYSSYGSSGGSAVSVAANLAVYALGTDTGVSVRVPSSANGVVGIRPSYDIINTDGVIKFESSRDTVGVIAKYVEDSAIVLEIIDNTDVKYSDYKKESLEGVTIGVVESFMDPYTTNSTLTYGRTDKFIYNMVLEVIEQLKELGAEIVYIDDLGLNYNFDAGNMCYEFNEYIKNTSSKIKSLDDLIDNGKYTAYIESYSGYYCYHDYTLTDYYKEHMQKKQDNIKIANNVFSKYNLDAVIYPTLKRTLVKIEDIPYSDAYTPSASTATLIGFPAMSLPMGTYNDLPYGIEILAKNEKEIYEIATAYENKNQVYKTPSIAPSLYTINEKVNDLLNKYDTHKNEKKYQEINNEVKNFIDNYTDEEDKIIELIEKYNTLEQKLAKKTNPFIFICIIIIIVLGKVKYEKIKRAHRMRLRRRNKRH